MMTQLQMRILALIFMSNLIAVTEVTAAKGPLSIPVLSFIFVSDAGRVMFDDREATLDCTDFISKGTCDLRGQWTLSNQTGEARALEGYLIGPYIKAFTHSGVSVEPQMTSALTRRMCDQLQTPAIQDNGACHRALSSSLSRGEMRGSRVTLAPHAEEIFEFSIVIRPPLSLAQGWLIPAGRARHVFFSDDQGERTSQLMINLGEAPIPIEIVPPESSLSDSAEVTFEQRISMRTIYERAGSTDSNNARAHRDFHFKIKRDQPVANGGPLFGLGSVSGSHEGLQARFGYHVYAPHWLQLELAADSNFTDLLVVSPTVEVVSPMILPVPAPSLGVGVGLPLEIQPALRWGARFQISVIYPFIGFVASFDAFRSHDSRQDESRWTLLGQLSF